MYPFWLMRLQIDLRRESRVWFKKNCSVLKCSISVADDGNTANYSGLSLDKLTQIYSCTVSNVYLNHNLGMLELFLRHANNRLMIIQKNLTAPSKVFFTVDHFWILTR